ncbi:MAG TPA: hypothetical protein VIF62_38235 [Labilithrix sp.]
MRALARACAFVFIATPSAAHAAGKCATLEQKHLEAPEKLVPLLEVAECHVGEAQYVLARLEYGNAEKLARARRDARAQKTAREGIKKTDAKIAWVKITADKDANPTELRIDGQAAQAGAATPVDPGMHTIEASYGDGGVAWSRKVELKAGDTEYVLVPPNPAAAPPVSEPPPARVEEPAPPAPPADTPPPSAPIEEEEPPHTGFVFDLVELLELYHEVPTGETSAQAGHAWVTVATLGWDFTPSLRAFARYGFVGNIAPEQNDALSISNAALGARYELRPLKALRVAGEGGLVFPLASGSGDTPSKGILFANVRARALYPALFDPNYLTPWLTASAMPVLGKAELRVDAGLEWMLRTSAKATNPDATKLRLVFTAHAGYAVLRQLVPYVELRYFRFLNDPSFVSIDDSLVDNTFGVLGVAVPLAPALPIRLSVSYLRALDKPLTNDDFQALALGIGGDL